MACTIWFSEALGSAEPAAFQKTREFFARQKSAEKKRPEIWENVVRGAKDSPWNATRQLFQGWGGACIKFIYSLDQEFIAETLLILMQDRPCPELGIVSSHFQVLLLHAGHIA